MVLGSTTLESVGKWPHLKLPVRQVGMYHGGVNARWKRSLLQLLPRVLLPVELVVGNFQVVLAHTLKMSEIVKSTTR